jgi:ribonuclease G
MDEKRNRQKVMQALEEEMRADRAPSKILAFNDFGLVALTRKRVKQSLERTLGSPCPYCEGVGLIKSPVTVCNEIYSEVKKLAPSIEREDLVLRVNPEVAKVLKAQSAQRLREMEEVARKAISVRPDPQVHQGQFEIY